MPRKMHLPKTDLVKAVVYTVSCSMRGVWSFRNWQHR